MKSIVVISKVQAPEHRRLTLLCKALWPHRLMIFLISSFPRSINTALMASFSLGTFAIFPSSSKSHPRTIKMHGESSPWHQSACSCTLSNMRVFEGSSYGQLYTMSFDFPHPWTQMQKKHIFIRWELLSMKSIAVSGQVLTSLIVWLIWLSRICPSLP